MFPFAVSLTSTHWFFWILKKLWLSFNFLGLNYPNIKYITLHYIHQKKYSNRRLSCCNSKTGKNTWCWTNAKFLSSNHQWPSDIKSNSYQIVDYQNLQFRRRFLIALGVINIEFTQSTKWVGKLGMGSWGLNISTDREDIYVYCKYISFEISRSLWPW